MTSPVSGTTVDSRTVTFSGTGEPGATVEATNTAGTRIAGPVTVAVDGAWTATVEYPESADVAQRAIFVQTVEDVRGAEFSVTFALPAATAVPPVTPVPDPTDEPSPAPTDDPTEEPAPVPTDDPTPTDPTPT
ncbi:MAG: hypothetical protein ABWY54_03455, partial [Glaciihabitans sp.]